MPNTRQQIHGRLRRRLRALLAVLRPALWDADQLAATRNGWTVEHGRFGRVVVRDPRFDQLRPRTNESAPVEGAAGPRLSAVSGRWQP